MILTNICTLPLLCLGLGVIKQISSIPLIFGFSDSKNLTCIFVKSRISLTEKLTNGVFSTPHPCSISSPPRLFYSDNSCLPISYNKNGFDILVLTFIASECANHIAWVYSKMNIMLCYSRNITIENSTTRPCAYFAKRSANICRKITHRFITVT